jgi:carboxymethylenebutenolidase
MGDHQVIETGQGRAFRVYVARPERGAGPGSVLLQEAFGVTEILRATADAYAEEGYIVAVPDLYWRLEPGVELTDADFDRAMELYQAFDVDQGIEDIATTVSALRACTGAESGSSAIAWAGRLVVLTAARVDVSCAVAYYPVSLGRPPR